MDGVSSVALEERLFRYEGLPPDGGVGGGPQRRGAQHGDRPHPKGDEGADPATEAILKPNQTNRFVDNKAPLQFVRTITLVR